MGSNWILILFLLLPVAYISGWLVATKKSAKSTKHKEGRFSPEYFKGLNYILDEKTDKAIEIFIKLSELDSETIETHLALGNLFRQRGEVDRAIRIHQNIMDKPTLTRRLHSQVLLELAIDYFKLGILDRSEKLFLELVSTKIFLVEALSYLLEIYQHENEWQKAIDIARNLEITTENSFGKSVAQFYCELAEIDSSANDIESAKKNLKSALMADQKCVRASIIEGKLLMDAGKYKVAIKVFSRVENQDPSYISEIILPLKDCYEVIDQEEEFKYFLYSLVKKNDSTVCLELLADIISKESGNDAVISFISEKLKSKPSIPVVDYFLGYVISKTDGKLRQNLLLIKTLTTKLLGEIISYQCGICGFEAKNIHWQCPGCKKWNTVKPAQNT